MEVDEREEMRRTWIIKTLSKHTYVCKMLTMSMYHFPCKTTTWTIHLNFSMAGIINECVNDIVTCKLWEPLVVPACTKGSCTFLTVLYI